MAIQGVPTLADIDFGALRQSRELNFKQKVLFGILIPIF